MSWQRDLEEAERRGEQEARATSGKMARSGAHTRPRATSAMSIASAPPSRFAKPVARYAPKTQFAKELAARLRASFQIAERG